MTIALAAAQSQQRDLAARQTTLRGSLETAGHDRHRRMAVLATALAQVSEQLASLELSFRQLSLVSPRHSVLTASIQQLLVDEDAELRQMSIERLKARRPDTTESMASIQEGYESWRQWADQVPIWVASIVEQTRVAVQNSETFEIPEAIQ